MNYEDQPDWWSPHDKELIVKLDAARKEHFQKSGRNGMYKCPYCTFINDDPDTVTDHILHDCDLAYND